MVNEDSRCMNTKGWYTANQPLFFAPIYMWNRFSRVDNLIVMMEAQYSSVYQRRCKLIGANGPFNTGMPIHGFNKNKHRPLNTMYVLDPGSWFEKFCKQMQNVYGRCPGYVETMPGLKDLLGDLLHQGDLATIADYGYWMFVWGCQTLDISCVVRRSKSVMPVRPDSASEWMAKLGNAVNCTQYLGGKKAGEAYVHQKDFDDQGVTLHVQNWTMPTYPTLDGEMNTDAWTSILDPLMLMGVEWTKDFVRSP